MIWIEVLPLKLLLHVFVRRVGHLTPWRLQLLLCLSQCWSSPHPQVSEGGMIRLETLIERKFLNSSFSNSNFSIRVVRAYPLIKLRQTILNRAIRGDSISVSSTLPPLSRSRRTRPASAARRPGACGRCCISRETEKGQGGPRREAPPQKSYFIGLIYYNCCY